MPATSSSAWKYFDKNQIKLPDPRIEIAKHMDWVSPITRKDTPWLGAEPDNYNFAVFDHRPYDFNFMQHQCFYKVDRPYLKKRIQGWISIYIAEERLQTILFNREMLKIQPRAVWRYAHAKPVRAKRTLVNREPVYSNRVSDHFTTEERLWQMGYYENLKCKYFANNENLFVGRVGTPRGAVLNYQPEIDSTEVEDY